MLNNIKRLLGKMFLIEIKFFKWVYYEHREIFWLMFTTISFYLVFAAFERPANIYQLFGFIVNFITFGQISLGSWYGGGDYNMGLTLWYVISSLAKGQAWFGELNGGGYGIGLVAISLVIGLVIPFVKISIIAYITLRESAATLIKRVKHNMETTIDKYTEDKKLIFINEVVDDYTKNIRDRAKLKTMILKEIEK